MFSRSLTFITVAAFVVASAAVARAGYQQEVLDLGPLDYWQLEETSTSSSAIDSASDGTPDGDYGSAVNPDVSGPTQPGFDSGNSAADFGNDNNPSNSYVEMTASGGGNYAPVTGSNARTVMAWINPASLGQQGDNDFGIQSIFTYGSDNGGKRFRFNITPTSGDTSTDTVDDFGVDFNQGYVRSATAPISTNEWQFVAFVMPNTSNVNNMKLYYNGSEVASLDTNSANVSTGSNLPFKIGQHDGKDFFNFDGGIDEVAVFDKKLTGTQIGDLYDAAVIPEPASLALLAPAGLLMLRRRRR